jgi:hypothetical protein
MSEKFRSVCRKEYKICNRNELLALTIRARKQAKGRINENKQNF